MYKVNIFSTLGRLCSNRRIIAIVEIIGHGPETEDTLYHQLFKKNAYLKLENNRFYIWEKLNVKPRFHRPYVSWARIFRRLYRKVHFWVKKWHYIFGTSITGQIRKNFYIRWIFTTENRRLNYVNKNFWWIL